MGPALFSVLIVSLSLYSAQEAEISVAKVSGDVYCLYGQGGNIGILQAEAGFFIVDAQYARTGEAVLNEIEKIGKGKIKYLINTHYHGDHTSGNPVIGKGALIISHRDCRESFLRGLKPEQSAADSGAPLITYQEELGLRFGAETVRMLHLGDGHTSGDTVVVFEQARVIHAGDLFFNGLPPYIDVEDGSDTANWIRIIKTLAEQYPDYQVIPGHGKVTDMAAWLEFADYLGFLREHVAASIRAGKSKEEAVASADFSKFAHIVDSGEFLTKKKNIEWVYDEITREK